MAGERWLLGLRRYSRAADVNNLRRNESWPTAAAAATSTRRPRQSGRNISRKSRFSTQDLFGATEWECEQAAGAGHGEGGEGVAAAASCAGGFALGSASISHFHKISNRRFI